MPEKKKEAPSGTAPLSVHQDERASDITAGLKLENDFSSVSDHTKDKTETLQDKRETSSIWQSIEDWCRKVAEVFK